MAFTDILNYKVIRLLGSGGMGSVYLAANVNIDQQVAIKVIRPELARNPEIRKRFRQEAELLCSLDHPWIVKFLNYVETDDGLFLIMEYVKGVTLKDFIEKKNGLIVESKAYPMMKDILDAFSYAHSKGIIHRDIKPVNIMVQDDGKIKIMDFGIAQIVSEADKSPEVRSMGTPAYMSPEQVYGRDVDARSDIYSIGVLLFCMLTGKAPYDSTRLSVHSIKSKVVNDPLPKLTDYYPYVSDKIQKVVDKATAKNPDERYQSCREMGSDVKKAIAPDKISKPVKYGGIAFLAILLIGGFLIWDYYRTKVEYYADYVEVYGVPVGVHKLGSGDVRHRAASYRFEKSRGKVRRVSHVNSLGNLVDHTDSETIDRLVDMELTYAEGSGKVDTEKFKDRNGRVLYVKDFDSNLKTCTFKLNDEYGTEMTLNSQVALFQSSFDAMLDGKSKISKYMLHFDDKGHLEKVEYAGFGNVKVCDGQGIFGKSYEYDDKGRVIKEKFLGKDGAPKSTKFGLGCKLFTYDDDDNLIKIEYQTPDGKPSSDGNNCPIVKIDYDKWGNRVAERYYTVDGKPALRKDNGVAGFVYEYNDKGCNVKIMYIGLDGAFTYSDGAAGRVYEYDDNGYRSSTSFIDNKGEAAIANLDEISLFRIETENDKNGNELEMLILGPDGKPMDSAYSPRISRRYDQEGKIVSEYYKNAANEIFAPAKYGYAGYEIEYNEQGRVGKITLKDAKKNNIAPPDLGYSSYATEYDARGNITSISYFDHKDRPVKTASGFSVIIVEYDDNGNEVSRSFLDEKGKPCVLVNFCSKVENVYDDQGNLSSVRFKDTSGNPMLVDGVAGYDYTYDERGNTLIQKPIGVSGAQSDNKQEIRYKYDVNDNIIEKSYWGSGGRPVLSPTGAHKEVSVYDESNNLIRMDHYGTDGKLRNLNDQNFAIVKMEYDSRNNQISRTFFDKNGNRGFDNTKVHKYYDEYDKVVNKISHEISFGVDGKPIVAHNAAPEGRNEFDKRGNIVKLICYDGYGNRINGNRGWCESRFTYNDAGETTSEAFFSIDGKPVVDTREGYHLMKTTYNPMRLVESYSVYDISGRPMTGKYGFSTVKFKYDSQGQKTEMAFFGSTGKPVEHKAGYHKEKYYYKNGSVYRSEIFDKNNRKIATGNCINNKWTYQGVGGGATMNGGFTDWRQEWRAIASLCPVKDNDGVTIKSVIIASNSITVVIMLPLGAEDIDLDIDQITKEMMKFLRKSTSTPSYVEIKILIYDKNNKLLN